MKIRVGIQVRLLLTLLGVAGATFLVVFGVLDSHLKTRALAQARERGQREVVIAAGKLAAQLERATHTARSLAEILDETSATNAPGDIAFFDSIAKRIFPLEPNYMSLSLLLDYRLLDEQYPYEHGYRRVGYRRGPTGPVRIDRLDDTSSYHLDEQYTEYRDANQEVITEPFIDYLPSRDAMGYVVSYRVPVHDNGGVPVGMVSVVFPLWQLQETIAKISPWTGAYCVLLSTDMRLLAGGNGENLGKPALEYFPGLRPLEGQEKRLSKGEWLTFRFDNPVTGDATHLVSTPIRIGNTTTPWTLCLVAPDAALLAECHATISLMRWLAVLGFLAIGIVVTLAVRRVTKPIGNASRSLARLSVGDISPSLRLDIATGDELEAIGDATNHLLDATIEKVRFARAIGSGKLDAHLETTNEDALGQSMLEMQTSLAEADRREQQQRQVEEQQAWATSGIAKFSELLRMESASVEDFSYRILHALSDYIKADIGALYLLEHDEDNGDYFRLVATHAYDVRKYHSSRIELEEGLVGRCARERKRIYLTDIPEDYVKIASGLGARNPDALLLVPVMMNDTLTGIIELARFGEFAEYVIQFVENIMGNFASTLVTVHNNLQTKELLKEAQKRSEEMSEQEEEMRQNMEELQAIQDESQRQAAEMESLHKAIQNACCIIEYDLEGHLVNANNEYLSLLRVSLSEIVNSHHSEGLILQGEKARQYQNFWRDLQMGSIQRHLQTQMEFRGRRFNFDETYAPICNDKGQALRIIRIAFFLSETDVNERHTNGPATTGEEVTPNEQ